MGKIIYLLKLIIKFYLSDIRQNFLKMFGILRQKVLQYSQSNTSSGIVRVAPAYGQNVR
jgi:hypothetical protein